MMDKRKMTIRIGKNTLSFTMTDATDKERPVIFEPYIVKGGISMTANLREAFKTVNLMATDTRRVQVLVDTPSMLVPIEQFEEEDKDDGFIPSVYEPEPEDEEIFNEHVSITFAHENGKDVMKFPLKYMPEAKTAPFKQYLEAAFRRSNRSIVLL